MRESLKIETSTSIPKETIETKRNKYEDSTRNENGLGPTHFWQVVDAWLERERIHRTGYGVRRTERRKRETTHSSTASGTLPFPFPLSFSSVTLDTNLERYPPGEQGVARGI